jgi:cell division protein FtsI/penicillin-binding protein 2
LERTKVEFPTVEQFFRRMFFLGLVLASLAVIGAVRVANLLLDPPPWITPPPAEEEVVLPAERGNIYDCNGYLLSVSHTLANIDAAPHIVTDTETLVDWLAPLLWQPREKLLADLNSEAKHVRLARGVRWEVAREIFSWEMSGVTVEAWPGRVYPHDSLAANVVGFVNDKGEAFYGVEEHYDELLSGEPGSRKSGRDPIGSLFYHVEAAHHGADLYLTLDRNVQHIVEEVLAAAVTGNEAVQGTAIVMEPQTGAILGMAVFPTYDPNTRAVDDFGLFVNSAISEHYEPGSVFKIVTVASGLDAGIISPASTYYDNGEIVVGGERIKNSDNQAHGETTIRDLLAESLNVGAAHISTMLGAFNFYEYVRRFGFNELTGVDLAKEVAGQVRFPGDREWHESDLGTNSFGQGLAVTPLQMLGAVSAVANGGVLVRPHIVDRIVDGDITTDVAPEPLRRVISPEAAAQVTEMLVYAVDTVLSTGSVPGYKVAGKSGTSQIPTIAGYHPEETIASFAGYAPAYDPRFAILVVIQRPTNERWGITAAGPAFREIAERLLKLYAVPRNDARTAMQLSGG